ncbi:MAG: hypothetical protein H7A46_15260 [Verrucomicrobiales bacterium]|nr:hypothetical protein [Verrucomicrobiales bacterium]
MKSKLTTPNPTAKPDGRPPSRKQRLLKRTGMALAAVLLLAALGVGWFKWRFRHYTGAAALADFRAGIAARRAPHPAVRFLELRYGSLDDPENRRNAFLHFFDPGRIEAMGIMVDHMDPGERRTNIADTAQWISSYRTTMSASEREALGQYLDSAAGQRQMQMATQQYLSRDVQYRSATAPVIAELMMTLDHARNR